MLCFTEGLFILHMKDLTREQASYIYKKVESGETINIDTIQQKMEQKEQLNKI